MSDCAKISKNQNKNCDNPIVGGVHDDIFLINFEDWEDAVIVYNETNPNIIEGISLPTGAYAYKMQGINNSPAPLQTFKRLPFGGAFEHKLNYKVFRIGPDTKKELELETKGRYVAIVRNNYRGDSGEAAFEVYGPKAGMVIPDGGLVRDPNSSDTQGCYDITLQSTEKALEDHLPLSIFLTDYSTTKAIVDALVAADE